MFWRIAGVIVYISIAIAAWIKVVEIINDYIITGSKEVIRVFLIVGSVLLAVLVCYIISYGIAGIIAFFWILLNIPILEGIRRWVGEEVDSDFGVLFGLFILFLLIVSVVFFFISPFLGLDITLQREWEFFSGIFKK